MTINDCYYLGKITRTHGLAGNVILKLDTDQPDFYNKLGSIFVEINGLLVPFFIEKQQWQKADTKIISFRNASQLQAEQTIGKNVWLPLTTLPELKGNQFYYHEVLGFELKDTEGNPVGTIKEINDQTTQHYFITKLEGKELIIPIIKDWIKTVDRAEKMIVMELPEGLLDVFLKPAVKDE